MCNINQFTVIIFIADLSQAKLLRETENKISAIVTNITIQSVCLVFKQL